MAGLFDSQAEIYAEARPRYPDEWFERLAALTPRRAVAWDAGTGNGQAAISLAEHYDHVIATDVSENQLSHATQHPRVNYVHTPVEMQEEELVTLLGGEGTVDLVTAATAAHYFDLPKFYAVVNRVLRKPGGVIAVWGYCQVHVSHSFDAIAKRVLLASMPFSNPNVCHALDEYRRLPFPFDNIGIGTEGAPEKLEIKKTVSFDGIMRLLRSWSPVNNARDNGVDLLPEEVLAELESAWGGAFLIREVTFPSFMLVGRPRIPS